MNGKQTVQTAFDRFTAITGIEFHWKALDKEIDGEVDLFFNKEKLHLFVETRNELRQHQLPQIFALAEKYKPLMIVANHIFPTIKEALREEKIAYLDAAGNIYLHVNKHFVWIDGNKPIEIKKTVTNRAFTKTGLKVVFHLLQNKEAIQQTYRQIAGATDVALGNINNVISGLKETGFVLQIDEKRMQLQNKKALLERWIAGYRETLKPSLLIGNYKFWNQENLTNWESLPINQDKNVWGGEPAAALLTNYLKPAILTLYTGENKTAIIREWKLIPVAKGEVQLYKKFWAVEDAKPFTYAPILLVYADLIITDDPRCHETAELIYNKYLKDEFERY
ncbi:MAG: type IV toxin-antitoxin system AbiEi family antitoxin [Mucilaginibacter sp.]|uniref:type IV toxin-antitoxin system AbiEi family antitoxin n=1 Tax=Mucilaginibacter sp. TaxID=1882438 RepID=UPI0034E518AC